jgi:hypothetical protein
MPVCFILKGQVILVFTELLFKRMSGLLSLSITVVVAMLVGKYVTSRKQHRPYPPGPKPKPFIGNALELPSQDIANVYIEWGREYNSESNNLFCPFANIWVTGDIIHASALGSHVVVLNRLEDAIELLEKRATKYSDRPAYPIQKL